MADLPAVNTLLNIVVDDEVSFPSRVEDVADRTLTISAPFGADDVVVPPDGSELEVFWTGPRTRYQVRAVMAGRTQSWPPHWRLRATSEPVRKTRRRFVRGGGGGPVTITAPAQSCDRGFETHSYYPAGAASIPQPYPGFVIDLSEAGARCRVRGEQTSLIGGEPVVVELVISDRTIRLDGTVLSVCDADAGCELEVVVTYEPRERDAQVIRQYVLQWEINQRGRARGSRVLAR